MPVYAPNDSLVGPVITALVTMIQAQIPSIPTIYSFPTDSIVEDNSVQFPYTLEVATNDTWGKCKVKITISIMHAFKRRQLTDTFESLQPYIMPWLQMLTAWRNQALIDPVLGQLSMSVDLSKVGPKPLNLGGMPYIGLVFPIVIDTEFNVDTVEP